MVRGRSGPIGVARANGKTLVIKRSYYPANTPADLAELKAIFDSIRIRP